MEFRQERQIPAGRIVGNAVLAVAAGALMPVIGLLQISLLVPVLMLSGILAARLWARAGMIPAGLMIAATAASAFWLMGLQVALMLLLAACLPAAAVMALAARREPFFRQLKTAIIAYAAGLVAATLIAYAVFGGGMVARFVNLLRAEYDRMPDAAMQPLVEWINAMLAVRGGEGLAPMTVEGFRAQLNGVLDLMQRTYAQALPGALISGAVLSGMLTPLWCNWTMARQGLATNESFVGMSGWYLPPRITFGALTLWLAGMILMYGGYASGATVYLTIGQVTGAIFAVQALCALDRRMLRADRNLGRRRALIGLLAVLALLFRSLGTVLCYIGAASALFGSHGAVSMWMKKRQDGNSDRDDSDE